ALRQLADQLGAHFAQRAALDNLIHPPLNVGCRDSLDSPGEYEIFIHFRLGQIADMTLDFERLLENVVSCNTGFSFGGRQEAGQNAHSGGLSRAVRPQETHDLTLLDFKTYVIYSRSPAIALGQTLHF